MHWDILKQKLVHLQMLYFFDVLLDYNLFVSFGDIKFPMLTVSSAVDHNLRDTLGICSVLTRKQYVFLITFSVARGTFTCN